MKNLIIFSLEGCGYSMRAENTCTTRNIDATINKVKYENKESIKQLNSMNTFPQIFLEGGGERHLIGGNSDLDEIINIIDITKNNKKFDNMVLNISQKLNVNKRVSLEIINILK